MEQPIKAGMILKTKFTTAGNKKFMEYINYIDRDEAVRNDNFQKLDRGLFSLHGKPGKDNRAVYL